MSLGTLGELYTWFPTWVIRGFVVFFGLIWGSFLNVVIYRVPREMSVVRPASHCPGCGKPIAGYDNIPVFTYVLLRGRARCCGAKMSPRYPMVELLGGALSLAILEVIIFKMPESTPAVRALAVYVADFALCMGLVAATFIDAEHMFLPDSITIGGTIVGIVTATLRGIPFTTSLVGAVVGFVGVWLPFIFLYKGFLGRTGMGMGDAKLLALAGAWFGWPGAVFVLFAGAVQGTVYAGLTRLLGIEAKLPAAVQEDIDQLVKDAAEGDEEAKKALAEDPLTESEDDPFILRWLGFTKKEERKQGDADEDVEADVPVPRARLPFGPFLILGCLELLFAGDWIASRLSPLFGHL
jgi:leader peptidase (prepilin peptidase) / N-methyltransferase